MARVIWTHAAVSDLHRIGDHIALDSPRYAERFTEKLRSSTEVLELFPGGSRMIPELEDPELRELIVGNYRIMFLLRKDVAYILTVRHAKRRFPFRMLGARKRRLE